MELRRLRILLFPALQSLIAPLILTSFAGLSIIGLSGCGQSPTSTVANDVPEKFTGPAIVTADPARTPGILCTKKDPDFLEYRYPEHIPYCQRNVGTAEKKEVAALYGVKENEFDQYEFDHFIPLSLGGSDDIKNLFPQRLDFAKVKDKLETQLYLKISAGKITQAKAVALIRAWNP